MAEKLRTVLIALAIGLILGGLVGEYGPTVWRLLPVVGPSGPIDYIVVIEETETRTPEQAAVLLGDTSRKLREANKWRMWDKDDAPNSLKPIIEKHKDSPLPYVLLFRGGEVVAGPSPLPATDAEWMPLLNQYGGIE